jgi:2-oxoglutarate dehydrogenase E1 component
MFTRRRAHGRLGGAEELAYASILEDGIPSGSPARTSARHLQPPARRVPRRRHRRALRALCSVPAAGDGRFEVHNSPLTENATIGFEFGYNVQAPAGW